MKSVAKQAVADASDVELLRLAGSGDALAFEEFHKRFKFFVKSVVHRTTGRGQEIEDVCQNAFLAIWKQAWRFDPARSNPLTWIALVTRSAARDAFRARLRSSRCGDLDGWDIGATMMQRSSVEAVELLNTAQQALKQLPERQRSVVVFAHARGLTRRQIAALEGLPIGTVKTLIRRGSERIRIARGAAA